MKRTQWLRHGPHAPGGRINKPGVCSVCIFSGALRRSKLLPGRHRERPWEKTGHQLRSQRVTALGSCKSPSQIRRELGKFYTILQAANWSWGWDEAPKPWWWIQRQPVQSDLDSCSCLCPTPPLPTHTQDKRPGQRASRILKGVRCAHKRPYHETELRGWRQTECASMGEFLANNNRNTIDWGLTNIPSTALNTVHVFV